MLDTMPTADRPRVARDETYEATVRAAWAVDPDLRAATRRGCSAVSQSLPYVDGPLRLYGRLTRPARPSGAGAVLFPTSAGPSDVFLHWRAESLAALGYTVLIADMLGDETGRGWDPAWTAQARRPLELDRALQRRRAKLVSTLVGAGGVDARRVGALGFCFGGQAALDLARCGAGAGVAAAASFHGILDDGVIPASDMAAPEAPRVLICHGDADPLVNPAARGACEEQLRASGARWELMLFGGVRHGFTNPAQALNANPAFGFDDRAATMSWDAMKALFQEVLL